MRTIPILAALLALGSAAHAQRGGVPPESAPPTSRPPVAALKLPPRAVVVTVTTAPLTMTGMLGALPPPQSVTVTTATLTMTGMLGALPPAQTVTLTTPPLTMTGLRQ